MPPKKRGRSAKGNQAAATATKNSKEGGISVGLVTDEEEDDNALGGARIEFGDSAADSSGMLCSIVKQLLQQFLIC